MIKQCYNCKFKTDCNVFLSFGNTTTCNRHKEIIKLYNNYRVIVETYYPLYNLVDVRYKNKILTVGTEDLK